MVHHYSGTESRRSNGSKDKEDEEKEHEEKVDTRVEVDENEKLLEEKKEFVVEKKN